MVAVEGLTLGVDVCGCGFGKLAGWLPANVRAVILSLNSDLTKDMMTNRKLLRKNVLLE